MANFTGEIVVLIAGEGPLLGECIDAAAIISLNTIPVESKKRVVLGTRSPVESRRGIQFFKNAPIQFLETTVVNVPPATIPIRTLCHIISDGPEPIEFTGTLSQNFTKFIPLEAFGGQAYLHNIPIESFAAITVNFSTPIQLLESIGQGGPLPVEFTGTLSLEGKINLPIESAATIDGTQDTPVEADGLIIIRTNQPLPIETLTQLVRKALAPIESFGQFGIIPHEFVILRGLSEAVLHEFIIIPSAFFTTIQHKFNLSNILGRTIDHSFRVIPAELITFFSDDIQLPFGSVEKD